MGTDKIATDAPIDTSTCTNSGIETGMGSAERLYFSTRAE